MWFYQNLYVQTRYICLLEINMNMLYFIVCHIYFGLIMYSHTNAIQFVDGLIIRK